MAPVTGVRDSYPAPDSGSRRDQLEIEFKDNEILWMLALCTLAEKGEFPHITLPYKIHGALVLSEGKWGIVPIKLRQMLDEQDRARMGGERLTSEGILHAADKALAAPDTKQEGG